jgi:hypothetical protein
VWKQPLGIYLLLFPAITAYFVSVGRERREAILILRKANGDLVYSSAKSQFAHSLIQETGLKQARLQYGGVGGLLQVLCCICVAKPTPPLLPRAALLMLSNAPRQQEPTHYSLSPFSNRSRAGPFATVRSKYCTVPAPSPFSGARPDLADRIGLGTQSLIHSLDSA